MMIDFKKCRVHLIVTPTDLRCGWRRLISISREKLNVDVFQGKDAVVFVSRNRGTCKMVFGDSKGVTMLTRVLHMGKFERILVKRNEEGKVDLTVAELASFLNGEALFEKRENFYPRE